MSALQTRHWVLGAALALSLAATLWMSQQDEAEESAAVQPVAGSRRSAPAAAARATPPTDPAPAVAWSPVQREPWEPPADAGFAAWSPPPPPPAAPAPPPPPPPAVTAPAFPYQLIGRLVDGDQSQALLAGPTRSLAVKAGELVDGQWRVDQISDSGLSLTWLPAKLSQTIAFRPTP